MKPIAQELADLSALIEAGDKRGGREALETANIRFEDMREALTVIFQLARLAQRLQPTEGGKMALERAAETLAQAGPERLATITRENAALRAQLDGMRGQIEAELRAKMRSEADELRRGLARAEARLNRLFAGVQVAGRRLIVDMDVMRQIGETGL